MQKVLQGWEQIRIEPISTRNAFISRYDSTKKSSLVSAIIRYRSRVLIMVPQRRVLVFVPVPFVYIDMLKSGILRAS